MYLCYYCFSAFRILLFHLFSGTSNFFGNHQCWHLAVYKFGRGQTRTCVIRCINLWIILFTLMHLLRLFWCKWIINHLLCASHIVVELDREHVWSHKYESFQLVQWICLDFYLAKGIIFGRQFLVYITYYISEVSFWI